MGPSEEEITGRIAYLMEISSNEELRRPKLTCNDYAVVTNITIGY